MISSCTGAWQSVRKLSIGADLTCMEAIRLLVSHCPNLAKLEYGTESQQLDGTIFEQAPASLRTISIRARDVLPASSWMIRVSAVPHQPDRAGGCIVVHRSRHAARTGTGGGILPLAGPPAVLYPTAPLMALIDGPHEDVSPTRDHSTRDIRANSCGPCLAEVPSDVLPRLQHVVLAVNDDVSAEAVCDEVLGHLPTLLEHRPADRFTVSNRRRRGARSPRHPVPPRPPALGSCADDGRRRRTRSIGCDRQRAGNEDEGGDAHDHRRGESETAAANDVQAALGSQ